jgi:cation diffusion facilitator CzcD-associated flavoprotein CzcO
VEGPALSGDNRAVPYLVKQSHRARPVRRPIPPDPRLPRACVIGAGSSGLAAAKALYTARVPFDCFERGSVVGGNWVYDNPNGLSACYETLEINTSGPRMAFSDFPMPDDYPPYARHDQVAAYFNAYVDHFGFRDRITFHTTVTDVARGPGGTWLVSTTGPDGDHVREYDAVLVANGHHWDPRFPDFPGEFTGLTMHSHHYVDPRTPHDLSGKRILVVGLGNSAADITVELSSRALQNEVTLSTRSGAWIVPKYFAGKPADKYYRTSPYVPLKWQRKLAAAMQPFTAGRPEDYGLPTPNHGFFEAHPTQSVELPLRLGSGDVVAKGNVTLLDGRTVHFEDGTSREIDVIVHATGYNITFPFFDPEFLSAPDNHLRLFKRMFRPGLDDLAFVGFAQATPTLFPFVECQTRLLGAYLVGRYALPDVAEMEAIITADEQKYLGHMLPTPRHTQQVDYFLYEHDLRARELPAGRRRAGAPA